MSRICIQIIRPRHGNDETGWWVGEGGMAVEHMEDAKVFFDDSKRTHERFLKYNGDYGAVPVRIVAE